MSRSHPAIPAKTRSVIEAGCRGIDTDGSLADAWAQMARAGVRLSKNATTLSHDHDG